MESREIIYLPVYFKKSDGRVEMFLPPMKGSGGEYFTISFDPPHPLSPSTYHTSPLGTRQKVVSNKAVAKYLRELFMESWYDRSYWWDTMTTDLDYDEVFEISLSDLLDILVSVSENEDFRSKLLDEYMLALSYTFLSPPTPELSRPLHSGVNINYYYV